MDRSLTRRAVLGGAGVGMAALAGCSTGEDEEPVEVEDDATWQTATLEDVTTGETFAIADIDEPVVLHTFATWCSTCKRQQDNFASLHEERGDSITIVDLTIDENDDDDAVASHAADNGFDWRFGVASSEVTRSLVDQFGQDVTTAPSSPVVVVCPGGTAQELGKVASADRVSRAIDENCA